MARESHECARIGDVARAARCAFWLAFALLNSGELARGGGWVDRAQRLLDERRIECVEQGYLRYAAGLRSIFTGDVAGAHTAFAQAVAMGELKQPFLVALDAHVRGSVLLAEDDPGGALVGLRRAWRGWTSWKLRTDATRTESLSQVAPATLPGGLTAREAEVLALVATGRTNRDIADHLVISRRRSPASSVTSSASWDRSRAAATACAYEHGLVS